MVQIIDRPKSGLQRLASGVHSAASVGIPAISDHIQKQRLGKLLSKELGNDKVSEFVKLGMEPDKAVDLATSLGKRKLQSAYQNEMMERMKGETSQTEAPLTMEQKEELFQETAHQQEQEGREMTPETLDQLWKDIDTGKFPQREPQKVQRKAGITDEELQLNLYGTPADIAKHASKQSSENFSKNEPEIEKAKTSLGKLKADEARLNRLDSLDNTGKISGGWFTKLAVGDNNQIRIPSVMSPEAQEYLKIINDFTTGLKDTFTGNISNFDLQTYLAKLPGLLQSPEGRAAVKRDLHLMNQAKMAESQAVMDVDRMYGSRISPSQFRQYVDERSSDMIERIYKEFSTPTVPYKVLTDEDMVRRIEEAEGNTQEEKIANAKAQASKDLYIVNGYSNLE